MATFLWNEIKSRGNPYVVKLHPSMMDGYYVTEKTNDDLTVTKIRYDKSYVFSKIDHWLDELSSLVYPVEDNFNSIELSAKKELQEKLTKITQKVEAVIFRVESEQSIKSDSPRWSNLIKFCYELQQVISSQPAKEGYDHLILNRAKTDEVKP